MNESLPEPILSNARFHFEKLKLNEQYATGAVLELWEKFENWNSEFNLGGAEGVRIEGLRLAGQMRRQFSPHYWKFALHEAVGRSPDFCSGGFKFLM
ncbi:hypothetical protein GCM10010399_32100 [Dactylosporangium fulvum]